jgi:hypothetical protein
VFFFTYRPIREPHITLRCNHSVRPYHLGAYFLGFLSIMHYRPFSLTVIHFSFHFPSSLNDTSLNNAILLSLFYPSIFQFSSIPSVTSFRHTIPAYSAAGPFLSIPRTSFLCAAAGAFPFNWRIPASSLVKFKHRSVLKMLNLNTNG